MTLEVQFKLKSNPLYIKYLHENSYWYKILTREPNMFNEFENEVKKNYKLRFSDRLNETLNTFEFISSIFSSLK